MPTLFAQSVFTCLSATRSRISVMAALLVCCASAVQAAGPTGLLNDTGQTQCDNGSNVMAACTAGNTGNSATYKGQDGRFGRDPAAPAKVGGGAAGFDFTKMCWNGATEGTTVDVGSGTCTGTLVANDTGAATGIPATDWACTKDNVTNLIWSLQRPYNSWIDATVITYPDAGHNSVSRCGFATGWRLPTRRELLSIVHGGLSTGPMVDANYFPATQSSYYWTSDPYVRAPNPTLAWTVYFGEGDSSPQDKLISYYVRLVRSGQ